jgi:hypothetical protein
MRSVVVQAGRAEQLLPTASVPREIVLTVAGAFLGWSIAESPIAATSEGFLLRQAQNSFTLDRGAALWAIYVAP